MTSTTGPSGPHPLKPSTTTTAGFFPAPSTTVGSGSDETMADFYSSAPPGSNGATTGSVSPVWAAADEAVHPHPHAAAAAPSLLLLRQLWSDQVSVELAASQLYLSASIWFRTRDMPGMAAWMLDESAEERGHGLAILEFAMKKKGTFPVVLQPLHAPRNDWDTPAQVWQSILEAEQTNTRNLLNLAAVAHECGDHAAVAFLGPFHLEQLDAEDKVGNILSTVQSATPQLMTRLDYELGKQAEEEEENH